jgi:hypothetical protein
VARLVKAFVQLRSDDTGLKPDMERQATKAGGAAGKAGSRAYSKSFSAGVSRDVPGTGRTAGRAWTSSFRKSAESESRRGGGILSGLVGAGAAVAAGVGLGRALGAVLSAGIDQIKESQAGLAQTRAVLKSTGGAARVTAKDVAALSAKLQQQTGVDDDLIRSSQNMLLTFTGVRNEVGKGNDIFDQATRTVLDMSQALGQDTKNSAIQLGKALNDPIKGVTALQRVGVTFTESQKKTIKSLVDSGDTLKAQKIILAELNKEFGGSAEAFGKTLPGQIEIAKNSFDDFSANIVSKFLPIALRVGKVAGPALTGVASGVATALGKIPWEAIASTARRGWAKVKGIFTLPDIGGLGNNIADGVKKWGAPLAAAVTTAFQDADYKAAGKAIADGVLAALTVGGQGVSKFGAILKGWLAQVDWIQAGKDAADVAFPFAVGFVNQLVLSLINTAKEHPLEVIGFLGTLIPVGKLAAALKPIAESIPILGRFFGPLLGVFQRGGELVQGAVSRIFGPIGKAFVNGFQRIFPETAGALGRLLRGLEAETVGRAMFLKDAAVKFITGFAEGVGAATGRVVKALLALIRAALAPFAGAGRWLLGKGREFVDGLRNGIDLGRGGLARAIGAVIHTMTAPFVNAGRWLIKAGGDLIAGLRSGMESAASGAGSWIKGIGDKIVGAVKGFFGIHSPSTVFHGLGVHMLEGLINGLASTHPLDIAKTALGGLPQALGAMVTKGFVNIGSLPGKAISALSGLKGFFGGLFGGGGGGGSGVQQWAGIASEALALAGAPQSWLPSLLRRMNQESGGNPRAINLTDINAQRGDPSRGLMQTIGSTFAAYAGPFAGRGIYDPLANIYAAIKYTIARYGSGPAGWDRAGGYDSGGLLMPGRTLVTNATGRPERVLNAEHTARLDALLSRPSGSSAADIAAALLAVLTGAPLTLQVDGGGFTRAIDARLTTVARAASARGSVI